MTNFVRAVKRDPSWLAFLAVIMFALMASGCAPYDAARNAELSAQKAEEIAVEMKFAALASAELARQAQALAKTLGSKEMEEISKASEEKALAAAAGAEKAAAMAVAARDDAKIARESAEAGGGWFTVILAALGGVSGAAGIAAGIAKGLIDKKHKALLDAVAFGERALQADPKKSAEVEALLNSARSIQAANGTRDAIKAAIAAVRK